MIVLIFIALGLLALFLLSLKGLIYNCAPNEVLIFSGKRRRVGDRVYGYRLIKGGTGIRIPFLERVDRMDLTNMVIDLTAMGAYSKGGVPLTVQGVANVKVAGHEPVLNNAIERFLGKGRQEIAAIAKATLEGSLRGVLASLTPEQVNEDRTLFAERLVQEVEADMTTLGMVVDTLKIQNVQDEVHYLDSIGRIRNAELNSKARTAEAVAKADSIEKQAENQLREVETQIEAEISVVKAEGQRRLTDALTRREAVVAEENATVAAAVAQAKAEVEVQKARIEQVRGKLQAEIIEPAKAACEAAEKAARAAVAPIVEDGKARAEALTTLAKSWQTAGDSARQIFLLQKIEPVISQITSTIAQANIEKITVIDPKISAAGGAFNPGRLLSLAEQAKEVFGIDIVEKLRAMGSSPPATPQPIESEE
jgi:flotillin